MQMNFRLLKHVITKANDETFQFHKQVSLAINNIEAIYSQIQCQDIEYINWLILSEEDLINRSDVKIESEKLSAQIKQRSAQRN